MNIALTGTKVVQNTKFLAFEKNNSVDVINVIVDTDESWTYKLDVRYPDKCCTAEPLYNIINLARIGNLCTAILTSDMLPFAGKYTMQLRGINGDKVAHSDVFDTWVKYSIEPGSTYEPIPSEFYQIEQNVTEMNNNPPYPSDDGYWMIWDVNKHEYTKSDIFIKILPTIDNTTKGKYLTNNGTDAEWADVEALPDMSSDTAGKMLTNDGKKAEWREVVNIIPDWQENNPEANDYIKNRCGGYDVVKTEQVNLSFNQPRAYSKEDGDVYFDPPQSGISVWMAYESDVIPSPEELLSATINGVGITTSNSKIFKPSDDFYYLNYSEVIPGTYGTNPPFMAVVTKKTTMWGYTFDKLGLYTYRAKYHGNDVEYVTSIEYVHSTCENVKIPEKYLDIEGSVLYDSNQALTDVQKTQARTNIGAGTSDFSGSYNDLTNKPTIPSEYTLPVASSTTLGGVKPVTKTDDMTQDIGVDADGKLWTQPGGGSSGEADISLGVTGAAVGQLVKITEIDADGKPTAWEAFDPAKWTKIGDTINITDAGFPVYIAFPDTYSELIVIGQGFIAESSKGVYAAITQGASNYGMQRIVKFNIGTHVYGTAFRIMAHNDAEADTTVRIAAEAYTSQLGTNFGDASATAILKEMRKAYVDTGTNGYISLFEDNEIAVTAGNITVYAR